MSTKIKNDRREYKRRLSREGYSFKLGYRTKDKHLLFDIFDICEGGLSILLGKSLVEDFQIGMDLENAAFYLNDSLQNSLNLKIVWIEKHSGDTEENAEGKEYRIGFTHSGDEATAAVLWETVYYYHFAKTQKTDEPEIDPNNLPRIPGRGLYTEEARQDRLQFIREKTSAKLEKVEVTSFDPQKLTGNIESFIGSIEIPVGIAGPMIIHGKNANGVFYAPLATSEGALVASVGRGAIAISKSGGATAHVIQQRMMRVPLFSFYDMEAALFFAEWIRGHFEEAKAEVQKYSNFANLIELRPFVVGRDVHVYFMYETGDAAGQNMTTTCTWNTCKWILKQMQHFKNVEIQRFLIDGSLSNDKRVTHQSFIRGRGIRVISEVFIPEDILQSVLKVTPDQLVDTYHAGVAGCIQASMVGINVNVANVIAAMFASTGQDIASVHESSLAHFHLEKGNDGVYATMMLPSLVIGTVGGGTNLGHQKECLEIIGCAGAGNSHKLAEIIASYCLALDLSTAAAIASGQFASAHERLGRNRLVNTLKVTDINEQFLTEIMRKTMDDQTLYVTGVEAVKGDDLGSSIITKLTSNQVNKLLGLFPYVIDYDSSGGKKKIEAMIKVKPMDVEVNHMQHTLSLVCDARLAAEIKKSKGRTGVTKCHTRELEIFKQKDPRFTRYVPEVYGIYRNDEKEAYVIAQEHLKNMVLFDSADDVSGFTPEHIRLAIDGIAEIHSIWYKREDELKEMDWIGDYPTKELMMELTPLWKLLVSHGRNEFPEWFSEMEFEMVIARIDTMEWWWSKIESLPKTLIHNDFNPRNLGYRQTDEGLRVCIYDWELATIHLPQHDIAEYLIFVLSEDTTREEVEGYVEYHRKALEKATGDTIDAAEWWEGFRCCMWDLLVNRIPMYAMAHTVRDYAFMERIHKTLRTMLAIARDN
ncbi:MAG: phosphotransferase [bacterium]|nr:phosphotransferase [bacterium]